MLRANRVLEELPPSHKPPERLLIPNRPARHSSNQFTRIYRTQPAEIIHQPARNRALHPPARLLRSSAREVQGVEVNCLVVWS